jgi:hypothetical protein
MLIEFGVRGSPLLPHDSSEWLFAKNVVAPNCTRPEYAAMLSRFSAAIEILY